jgi:hypothetical protein
MLAIPAVLEPEGQRFSDQIGAELFQDRFQIIHRYGVIRDVAGSKEC